MPSLASKVLHQFIVRRDKGLRQMEELSVLRKIINLHQTKESLNRIEMGGIRTKKKIAAVQTTIFQIRVTVDHIIKKIHFV
jgi:hypothetical protein